jgi:hypothetical protein
MLELYNTTDRVRRVPKYHYAGEFVLKPRSAVDIEDFMADFYKPWGRIGIVVRVRTHDNPKPKVSTSYNDAVTITEIDASKGASTSSSTTQETVTTSITDDTSGDKTENSVEESTLVIEPVETIEETEDSTPAEPEVPETSEVSEPLETPTEEVHIYTQDELSDLGMPSLKDIASKLDVTPDDTRKKQSYIDAILTKQAE